MWLAPNQGGRGEMIKSNQSPKSATILKKDSMVDYLFSHKAVIQISLLMSFLFMWK